MVTAYRWLYSSPPRHFSPRRGHSGGRVVCVLHTCCSPPRILHPMRGMKNGGRGSVGASWLAISGRQVPRLTPRKVNCRLKESKLPTEESKLPTEESKLPTQGK
jgi:hypothetical protein